MRRDEPSDGVSRLSIGEAAKESGVKIATIRYYEQIGLLGRPARAANNRRSFDAADLRRLGFIRHARELGFEIDAIRQLLALADQPERPCSEVDAIAQRHLAEIESRMKRLKALKIEVSHMIAQCARGSVADCRIIDVLAHHEHCMNTKH